MQILLWFWPRTTWKAQIQIWADNDQESQVEDLSCQPLSGEEHVPSEDQGQDRVMAGVPFHLKLPSGVST